MGCKTVARSISISSNDISLLSMDIWWWIDV